MKRIPLLLIFFFSFPSFSFNFTQKHQIALSQAYNLQLKEALYTLNYDSKKTLSVEDVLIINQILLFDDLFQLNEIQKRPILFTNNEVIKWVDNQKISLEEKEFCKARIYFSNCIKSYAEENETKALFYFLKSWQIFKKYNNTKSNAYFQEFNYFFNIFLGNIPENLSWITDKLGFKGNQNVALKSLDIIKETDVIFKNEALLWIMWSNTFIKREKINFIEKEIQAIESSYKNLIITKVLLLSIFKKNGNGQLGYVLSDTLQNDEMSRMSSLYYYKACFQLYKGEFEQAKKSFKKFIISSKLPHYKIDSYFKLLLIAKIENDIENQKLYTHRILNSKIIKTEADRYAFHQIVKKNQLNTALIKSRLFFDGGYLIKADSVLENTSFSAFNNQEKEYFYRKGKVKQALTDTTDAVNNFEKCINQNNTNNYFDALACLNIGELLWKKDSKKAKKYLDMLFTINDYDYQNDTRQKAKIIYKKIDSLHRK